ncbi:MAG: hypothetical protein ACI8ZB_000975 [Desulforhopalus sp.]|jgi:hypothetical protein
MQIKSYCKKIAYGTCVLLLAGLLGGCAGNSKQPMESMGDSELAPVATMVESYGDIELPIEMVLDAKNSMAMRTDSFQGGIHVYKGRVQVSSLRDYIIASMRNNKWKLVGEASYNNVMLAFTKPNKTCMVVLSESSAGALGKTQANFYVTVDVAAASRLNPFGEPIKQ